MTFSKCVIFTEQRCCSLCFDVPTEPHAVIGGALLVVAGSRVCGAVIGLWCNSRSKGTTIKAWSSVDKTKGAKRCIVVP